ncbi:hypothetical protein AWR27_09400 [Spirosoma montaniterrae]|uniref:Uncharacterized protein n=1 Tax=Spirosoma montaniterrae TaxID=1178516 RepID=A0A1P9WVV4_9BACT|nr:hypothetical protein AWR27_09400 [Spirosoma montaniterrae]
MPYRKDRAHADQIAVLTVVKNTYLILLILFAGCRTTEPVPVVVQPDPVTASQASLVSVQATGASSAEVIVKSIRMEPSGWRLTAQTGQGGVVPFTVGETQTLRDFMLTSLRLSGLTVGQTYQLRLAFRFADRDSITALRTYTHRLNNSPTGGPRWTRLAHASFSGGDYTTCPVAVDGICGSNPMNGCGNPTIGAYVGNQVQVVRYAGPTQPFMDVKIYNRQADEWQLLSADRRTPRHGFVQYNVFFQGVDRHQFSGLGYIIEERSASKYFFFRGMGAIFPVGGSPVNPSYGGEDGELVFFTTTDEAYFLTQNGSPAMRSIDAVFTQTVRAPLPEPPGLMATFSIRNIGYVVNQRPGQPTRLWAYNPATDSWTKRADFPGDARQRGVGFAMARQGYFGLGVTAEGRGCATSGSMTLWPTAGSTSRTIRVRAISLWPSSVHPTGPGLSGLMWAGATKRS